MSDSNTIIGINFGTAYTSIAYINKVKKKRHDFMDAILVHVPYWRCII